MLDPGGPAARSAAALWWGMFGVASLVLAVLAILWVHAMRRKGDDMPRDQAQRLQDRWIVAGGFVLPLTAIALLLAFGIPAGQRMLPLPPGSGEAMVVEVQAEQWRWQVHYPQWGISGSNELHIPANTPVDVHLTTADVIHSFWVPRLAGKLDAIPGRVNVLRLEADRAGVYHGQCAEFCGRGHARMHFTVIAHPADEYSRWVTAAAGASATP